jgi:hypothetical protein
MIARHSSTMLPQLVDVQITAEPQALLSVLPPRLTEPMKPVFPPIAVAPPWFTPPLPPELPPPAGGLPAFRSTPPVAEQAPSKMMIPRAPSFVKLFILNPFPRTSSLTTHYVLSRPSKKPKQDGNRHTSLCDRALGFRCDEPVLPPPCRNSSLTVRCWMKPTDKARPRSR